MATIFTGAPYAKRHFELAQSCPPENRLGHKILGSIEYIPLIGVVVACSERLFADKELKCCEPRNVSFNKNRVTGGFHKMEDTTESIDQQETSLELTKKTRAELSETAIPPAVAKKNENSYRSIFEKMTQSFNAYFQKQLSKSSLGFRFPHNATWVPRSESIGKGLQRMEKNALKAIEEHISNDSVYASPQEIQGSLEREKKGEAEKELKFTSSEATHIGRRDSNQDAHFYSEDDFSVLAGVFDGHGGSSVANYSSIAFKVRFRKSLEEAAGNVHHAFEHFIHKVHQEVEKNSSYNRMGSTALICYIDKKTRRIYTATVGDSEANIYRMFEDKLKSIPLSCVRHWGLRKEALRVAVDLNRPDILEAWMKTKNPKKLRYPIEGGINVSRAIGDACFITSTPSPLIHKPKITVQSYLPGDIITLACDGIKDYTYERELVEIIQKHALSENLAKEIGDFVIKSKSGRDNTTVVAIKVAEG